MKKAAQVEEVMQNLIRCFEKETPSTALSAEAAMVMQVEIDTLRWVLEDDPVSGCASNADSGNGCK